MTRRAAISAGAAACSGMLWTSSAFAARRAVPHFPLTEIPPFVVTPSTTTSLTAVLGAFPRGPVDAAVLVGSWDEFTSRFGMAGELPFGTNPSLSVFAVRQFFANGGTGAWIVRLAPPAGAVTNGNWTAEELRASLLAQLGASSDPSAPAPALTQIAPQLFNIMCLPDLALMSTAEQMPVIAAAQRFCSDRRAFLIVDPPPPSAAMAHPWLTGAAARPVDDIATPDGMKGLVEWADRLPVAGNDAAAAYYPWVGITDPWNGDRPRYVPPSGSVAGMYARNDATAGVWEPPGNVALRDIVRLADLTLTDSVRGAVAAHRLNCLRVTSRGTVAWGARTLAVTDRAQLDFWRIETRRLIDYIELALRQTLPTMTAGHPNDSLLWTAVTAWVSGFLTGLWQLGALFGSRPSEGFYVDCDSTTTSAADIRAGIVNLHVGIRIIHLLEFVDLTFALPAARPTR